MKSRTLRLWLALFPAAIQTAISAPEYILDFNKFPGYAYNTAAYKQGGAFVGCGPTTGAMIFAYFQLSHSLSDLLLDPGVAVDTDLGLNTAWALHGSQYMKTQATGFGDVLYIESGLEKYAADRGFTVGVMIHAGPSYSDPNSPDAAWLNAYGPFGDSWTNDGAFWIKNANGTWKIDPDLFCDFLSARLTLGVPIFLTIDTNADGGGDHWVPLVGYDRSTKQYAFYNTYDANLHWADIYYMGDPAGKKVNSISMVRTVELIPAQPDVAVDWTSWDFGTVAPGDNSVHYLTVTNAGAGDLVVSSIYLAGSNPEELSILNGAPFTLAAGNGRQVGVKYSPASAGSMNATMTLMSNDPDESPLVIGLTGTGGNPAEESHWQKAASPGAGGINCIAVKGTRIYAGTVAGGVIVSTNEGSSWTPYNEGLTNLDVRALLISGPKVYAGTWGEGIFISEDEGAHWNQIKSGMTNLYVTSLAIDPPGVNGYQRMLAGTWGGGVFLTTSNGQTWTDVSSGITETHVRSVLLNGSRLFAGTINGLFRSSNMGQSWTTANNGLTNTAVISLLRRGSMLFAGTDGGGVFSSDDNGDSWAAYFLGQDNRTIPDLASIDITLFAAAWGAGVFRKSEDSGPFDAMDGGLSEPNVRCLALLSKGDESGKWNLLAGTENGNIWSWTLEKTYPVVVDGEKDAFYDGLSGPADGLLQFRPYDWNDNGKPVNADDLSAYIWTSWDEDWFYLFEFVADNVVSGNAVNVWEEDCIELKFDPQPADTTVNSVWDTRLTALDDANEGVVAWDNLNNVPENAWKQWARRTFPGGYVQELAIRWQAITSQGETIDPQIGTEFGMAINQHDNDGDARRRATLQWGAVLLDAVWNTPKFMGTVKLLPDHKMQFIPTNKMTGVTNPVPYDGSDYSRETGVDEDRTRPVSLALGQNYPNPFNPSTVISYSLPGRSEVRLSVIDILGREVAVPVHGTRQAGAHTIRLNAASLASGIYFYRLEADGTVLIRKMILSR